jgi:hypothetical protein
MKKLKPFRFPCHIHTRINKAETRYGAHVMKRNQVIPAIAALILAGLAITGLYAEDFHKVYPLGPHGHIMIRNVSGDVRVVGYKGETVVVDAFKVGRDRDLVKVEDQSAGDSVSLRVSYPERGNCDASVNFEVQVPLGIEFNFDRLASVSGNVTITSARGRLKAESVSGNVNVKDVSGMVSASSVSGNVDVAITRLEGTGEMKFGSVSGNVSVRAPATLDADIEMSTVSGSLKTDFQLESQERRYGPGRSARGRLGSGASNLRITSVSGRVSLTRI